MGKNSKSKRPETISVPFVSLSNDKNLHGLNMDMDMDMDYSENIKEYEKQLEQKTYLIDELLKKVKQLTNELNQFRLDHLSNNDILNIEITNLKLELEKNSDKIDKLSWFIVKTGVDYSELSLFD